MDAADSSDRHGQFLRYVINGIVATLVHYGALVLCLEVLHVPSAGVSNLFAATAGIATSFLGSRHIVFRARHRPILGQAGRFGALYGAIALLHGAILWAWSDVGGQDYRLGFLFATGLQFALSYFGNKHLVFR